MMEEIQIHDDAYFTMKQVKIIGIEVFSLQDALLNCLLWTSTQKFT